MTTKYKKITGVIDADYAHYAAQKGLYHIAFFGHKGSRNQYKRLEYIWNRLLIIYYGKARIINHGDI